jgi:hypothetical protein
MPFATGHLNDPVRVGAGERFGDNVIALSAQSFQAGLVVGVFARMVGTTLSNFDASATPNVAGVVLRNIAGPVEAGATIDATLTSSVEYVRSGMVTVQAKAGQTAPAMFAAVFADNVALTTGQAMTSGGVATNAEFIREERPGVWLVRLR